MSIRKNISTEKGVYICTKKGAPGNIDLFGKGAKDMQLIEKKWAS